MTIPPNFHGTAIRMQPGDLIAVAKLGGYEVAALQAVMDVEAGAAGFDGCRPKILVEPHVFYRELWNGKMGATDWRPKQAQQAAAVRAGLAYPAQGTRPYLVGVEANYARLAQMIAVNETAALRSCSWGLGQIMGFNAAACGYPDVRDMVAACCESEAAQFRCMLRYIEHAGLAAALKGRDWRTFARGYNGSGAVDAYSGKLATAYARRAGAAPVRLVPRADPAPSLTDSLNDAEWLRVRAGFGS